METDRLYQIFHTMLHQTHCLEETAADFIRRVADAYTTELLGLGEIPAHLMASVTEDLEAETLEMYRKKTYGCLSLKEYRQQRCLAA